MQKNIALLTRSLEPVIKRDLKRKMVFVSGPRQIGKTTLAKQVLGPNQPDRYLNWDIDEDRTRILKGEFPLASGILVLDEIHKYRQWRQLLKGLYDKRGEQLQILVTGSARLDHYRYGGDSLQGRYYFHRLHPLSVAELNLRTDKDLRELMRYGGFPESYCLKDPVETQRFSNQYRSRVIRDELRDLERVTEVDLIERLALRLPELVGSPLSINALREDLQVSHATVARWISILENLYFIFRIYPFGAPQLRAVKKEAKHYHYDWTQIDDEAARFENLVACHLLKWCHHLIDTEGRAMELRYFRDVDRREVDFVITEKTKPVLFLEAKLSNRETNSALKYLRERFPKVEAYQISLKDDRPFMDKFGIRHLPASSYLRELI
jgi:predicted AAA+ superfamily ATPase